MNTIYRATSFTLALLIICTFPIILPIWLLLNWKRLWQEGGKWRRYYK